MRKIDKVNADGTTYAVEPPVARVVEQGNHLPVTSGAVWDAIKNARTALENAIALLQPSELSSPVLFDGETYTTVESLLAAISESHTDTVTSDSTQVITAGGAFSDKTDAASEGDSKNFTAGGAYRYFAKQTTALAWLKKVFGNDYETKLANGYFVD